MNKKEILTNEKFKNIYTNEKFRNEVAYAHICIATDKSETRQTCSYPIRYVVTDAQIKEAQALIAKTKKEVLAKHKNNLLFVGMGMTYNTDTEIGNYRIRTEFLNSKGYKFFVEFGKGNRKWKTRVDFAIDLTLQNKLQDSCSGYNYKNLERGEERIKNLEYTPQNILNIVNDYFDCEFKNIIIDNYNIACNGVICESPKN